MTKSEIKKLIKYYAILFPATKTIADIDTINVWFDVLNEINFLDAKRSLRELSVTLDRIPNVTDIVQHIMSDNFVPSLYDTYQEYPYDVETTASQRIIQIAVSWSDKKIVFKYPAERKDKAMSMVARLKARPTMNEIMCLWDEDMANCHYGTCRKTFGL
ncbi:hypothetical protein [Erysipelatoclostridium sp. An173]|uniref:hypothetical protein n=1 Tax=Erysipelatoclostridium sp. An173 TaxID=1965571 RepID=UPI00320A262C